MRINETQRAGMIHAYNKHNQSQTLNHKKPPMGRDDVKISQEAIEMLKLGEEPEEVNPARLTYVRELKQKVESGTYWVPSDKIAEKFISFWKKG